MSNKINGRLIVNWSAVVPDTVDGMAVSARLKAEFLKVAEAYSIHLTMEDEYVEVVEGYNPTED